MEPVRNAWQNPEFRNMSSSFGGFCELLGLEKVGPFMQSQQAASIEDWSSVPLDDTGKGIQEQMTKRFQVRVLKLFINRFSNLDNSNFHCVGQKLFLQFQQRSSNERNLHMNLDALSGAM